jgi:transcriptional regulator with XRE-family HTH domain
MMNPYKFLRQRAGYTQKRFCDDFNFAKQTLISIEQGVYEDLSERMLIAMSEACGTAGLDMTGELEAEYGDKSLATAYKTWRREERSNCDVRIVDYVPVETNELSPMHWFVKDTVGSVQGFAKQLKVQTAILLSYIRGKQKEMPYPLREALVDAGYPHVALLEKYQTEWNKERG